MLGQHGHACIQRLTCAQLACCVYAVAPVSSDQRSWDSVLKIPFNLLQKNLLLNHSILREYKLLISIVDRLIILPMHVGYGVYTKIFNVIIVVYLSGDVLDKEHD